MNYDLPWNPMRIEQRIGRIDRRGSKKSEAVAIINLLTRGTIEAEIYDRCFCRIGVFNHALGGSEQILGEITEAIVDIATSLRMTGEERNARYDRSLTINCPGRGGATPGRPNRPISSGYAGKSFGDDVAEASSEWLDEAKDRRSGQAVLRVRAARRAIALRPEGRVAKIPAERRGRYVAPRRPGTPRHQWYSTQAAPAGAQGRPQSHHRSDVGGGLRRDRAAGSKRIPSRDWPQKALSPEA